MGDSAVQLTPKADCACGHTDGLRTKELD
jgi:hypothetical protein